MVITACPEYFMEIRGIYEAVTLYVGMGVNAMTKNFQCNLPVTTHEVKMCCSLNSTGTKKTQYCFPVFARIYGTTTEISVYLSQENVLQVNSTVLSTKGSTAMEKHKEIYNL